MHPAIKPQVGTNNSRDLMCPMMPDYASGSVRQYRYNGNAQGNGSEKPATAQGDRTPAVVSPGFLTDPPTASYAPDATLPPPLGALGGSYYFWGAKLTSFGPQAFLVTESENASDTTTYRAPDTLVMGDGINATPTKYPAWTAGQGGILGMFGFRRAYFTRANLLFFDSHVEFLGTGDQVNTHARFDPLP